MASNRHLGRIVALQTLYELDFRIEVDEQDLDIEEVILRNISRYSEIVDDKEFIEALIHGVLSNENDLDAFIQPLAPDWPLDQIARIDRTVLRMGLWEMQHTSSKVPIKVIINEAVELAKGFGADNASKFVNGVLGTAARKLKLVEEKDAPKKATAKKQLVTDKRPATVKKVEES
jgi:N utilization substance protein B